MLGIPNPYAIAGGMILGVAALGGCYVAGRMDGARIEQSAEFKAEQAAQKVRDQLQGQIDQSATQHQQAENDRQQGVREIDHEKETIVERPVYTNICIDSAGVGLLQRAAALANGQGQPGAPGSSATAPVTPAN
jgi:outer membrane murein-binding lipoprotein Lpp